MTPFTLAESDVQYFGQISPASLKVLKLLHYEKMSYVEIVRDTGWAMGTLKSRLNRTRAIIRKLRAADEPAETWQEPTWGTAKA